jgi:hypothetical protein
MGPDPGSGMEAVDAQGLATVLGSRSLDLVEDVSLVDQDDDFPISQVVEAEVVTEALPVSAVWAQDLSARRSRHRPIRSAR